jgi:acyl-CoA synthetase (AMP-forming)/AMP-acid ligase II
LLHPAKDWLIYEDERYTYKEVFDKAAQTANALKNVGVEKGDRVAICMMNNPEYIVSFMAITGMGAVVVPLNSWWVPSEVSYGLEHCDAKVLIADEKRLIGLEKNADVTKIVVRPENNSDYQEFNNFINNSSNEWPDIDISNNDNATLFYTSGSTGFPKGVLSSNRNVLATLFSWTCYSSIRGQMSDSAGGLGENADGTVKEISVLHCVPLFHVTGSHSSFLISILVGRKIVMMKKWDATEALKLIEQEKITNVTGVPTQSWEILSHPEREKYDISSLEDLGGGGAARPAEHVKQMDEQFEARPSIGYGLSETNALGTLNGGDEYLQYPSSCGRIVPPLTDINIIDANWNTLKEGEVGEVVIKSPGNMVGYWKNPEATAEVFNDDGWFKSGDLGYFDGPFLHIVDRVKDLVIRGGENISCIEVEAAIYEHSDVLEACIIGIPDERLGEQVAAAIHLKPGVEKLPKDIQEFLDGKIAKFKIPFEIRFYTDPLPKIASGKFDKPQLRKLFAGN